MNSLLSTRGFPLISIVTVSFNQARYLEETIQSVLNQDYPNLEYIIIDGGSQDGSVEIIQKYASHLAYWVSEPDRGQTHALIKGFQFAHGDLLGWLCSDDLLEPSMISISAIFHQQNPRIALTYGDRIRIDAKGNIYSAQRFPSFRSWYLKWGFSIPQETTLFKRKAFEIAGGLDETLHMAMDFDLWCRLVKLGGMLHIPAFLGRFRQHANNKSTCYTQEYKTNGFASGYPAEYARVYQKYFGVLPQSWKVRIEQLLRNPLAMLDRRTKRYRDDLDLVTATRQR